MLKTLLVPTAQPSLIRPGYSKFFSGILVAIAALGSSVANASFGIGDVSITPIGPTSGRTIMVAALHPDVTGLLVSGSPGCAGGIFQPSWQPIEYTLPNANDWNTIYTRTTTDTGEGSECTENRVLHDDQNPIVVFTVRPNNFTAQSSASFEFSVVDGATGSGLGDLNCQLDTLGWQPCLSPTQLSGLSEGEHVFEVQAIDQAGNRSEAIAASWIVDLTAPIVNIAGPPDLNGIVRFSGDDGPMGSGIARFFCAIDSNPRAECSSPFSVGSLAAGSHSLSITAVDQVGHESAQARVEWVTVLPQPSFDVKIKGIIGPRDSVVDAFFLGQNQPWVKVETVGQVDSMSAHVIGSSGKTVCSLTGLSQREVIRFDSKCQLDEGSIYIARVVAQKGTKQVVANFGFIVDTTKPKVSVTKMAFDPNNGDFVVTFAIDDKTPIVNARCILFTKKKGRIEYDCTGKNQVRFSNVSPNILRALVIRAQDSVGLRGRAIEKYPNLK